jgi:hypothetical protein
MAKIIDGLTDDPAQQFFAVIDGYDSADIVLEWKPNQFGWFMNLTWGDFSVKNVRLGNFPNVLQQYKNVLPFGIGITGTNGLDPLTFDAWTTNNQFYILDESDIAAQQAALFNG